MARQGRVRIYFDAESRDLVREANQAERALKGVGAQGVRAGTAASAGLTKATTSARAFSAAGRGAAATATRVGNAAKTATPYIAGGLALGLGKSVVEYREAEKVGNQTAQAIRKSGGAAKVTADEIANLASALSHKIGVDDEAIQSSSNLLLTFHNIRNEVGEGNKVFDRATKLVQDMSVAMDQSAKTSAVQLGKALNDPLVGMTALGRAGVQFSIEQKDRIAGFAEEGRLLRAQKVILNEVAVQFGGSAKAQADSFDKLTVAGENFAEKVGGKVTPTLSEMADELSAIVSDPKLTSDQRLDRISDFFEKWATKGIEGLEDAAPKIAETMAKLAGRGAVAFGKSFLEADALGKIFLAGAFIRAVGGPGVFGKLGGALGGLIWRGVGGALGRGGLFGRLAPTTVGGPGGALGATPATAVWVRMAGGAVPGGAPGGGKPTPVPAGGKPSPGMGGGLLGAAGVAMFGASPDKLDPRDAGMPQSDFAKEKRQQFREEVRQIRFLSDARRDYYEDALDYLKETGLANDAFARRQIENLRAIQDAERPVATGFKFAEAIAKDGKVADKEIGKIIQRLGDLPKGARKEAAEAMIGMAQVMEQKGDLPEGSAKRLRRMVTGEFGDMKLKSTRESAQMVRGIGQTFANLVKVVTAGLGLIGQNTNDALRAFGVEPVKIALQKGSVAAGLGALAANGAAALLGGQSRQKGGYLLSAGGMLPGYSPVDNVPAMLRSGEAVLTPEVHQPVVEAAMQATYGMGLTDLFRTTGAAYAKGGVVDRTGVRHFAGGGAVGGLQPGIANLASSIAQRFGLSITSGVRPGDPGFHGQGLAADLSNGSAPTPEMNAASRYILQSGIWRNLLEGIYSGTPALSVDSGQRVSPSFWGGGTWAAHANHLHLAIGKNIGGLPATTRANIKRVLLRGPEPLRSLGQGALDRVRKAAQGFVTKKRREATGFHGANLVVGPGNLAQPEIARLWRRTNRFGDSHLMSAIAMAESGGNPNVTNSIGARGLFQIIPSTASGFGLNYGRLTDPAYNTFGAGKILQGQGLGAWEAYTNGAYRRYMRKGGYAGRGFKGFRKGGKAKGKKPGTTHQQIGPAVVLDPAYSYDELLILNEISLTQAGLTETTADDLAALTGRGDLLGGRKAAIERKLAKGGLTGKQRTRLLEELSSLTSELASNSQQIAELQQSQEQAQAELAQVMQGLKDSIDEQNRLVQAVGSSDGYQAMVAVADLLSGQLGGRVVNRSHTAAFGSVGRS